MGKKPRARHGRYAPPEVLKRLSTPVRLKKPMKRSKNQGGDRGGRRPKGSANRVSRFLALKAAGLEIQPLDYMLKVMRSSTSTRRRDEMAKAAAPFVHPKLSATKVTGGGEGGAVKMEHKVTINYVRPKKKVEE